MRGCRLILLVLMLTTAGEALRAAPLRLPGDVLPAGVGGASSKATPMLPMRRAFRFTHWG